MRRALVSSATLLLLSCAAGAIEEPAAPLAPSAARADAGAGAPTRCADGGDLRELLVRHARRYGTEEQVRAALPLSMSGTISLEGRSGRVETVLAPLASRVLVSVAGILAASGVDANGAWTLDGGSGVVERQSGAEAVSSMFDDWLLRRSYVTAFTPESSLNPLAFVTAPVMTSLSSSVAALSAAPALAESAQIISLLSKARTTSTL